MKYKTLQRSNDLFIQFDEEEIKELNIQEGEKFSIKLGEDDTIRLDKLVPIEFDLNEFPREVLEEMIIQSEKKDVSVGEILTEWLELICNNLRKKYPKL